MAEFMAYRERGSLGPTFNEAAAILKARTDLTVKREMEFKPDGGVITFETTDQVARALRGDLPGWLVGPNYKIGPC